MHALAPEEKMLLKNVLEVTGDDERRIRDGVIKALHGIKEEARRTYLWNLLFRVAKKRIRRARRKSFV